MAYQIKRSEVEAVSPMALDLPPEINVGFKWAVPLTKSHTAYIYEDTYDAQKRVMIQRPDGTSCVDHITDMQPCYRVDVRNKDGARPQRASDFFHRHHDGRSVIATSLLGLKLVLMDLAVALAPKKRTVTDDTAED